MSEGIEQAARDSPGILNSHKMQICPTGKRDRDQLSASSSAAI